jgi:hypothetical protein
MRENPHVFQEHILAVPEDRHLELDIIPQDYRAITL